MLSMLLALSAPADAHDFYLEVSPAQVEVGDKAKVYGVVAHATERDTRSQRVPSLTRLDAWIGGEAVPVPEPMSFRGPPSHWGFVPTATPGVVPVVYTNSGAEVSLAHDRFVAYVRGEGDDRQIEIAEGLSGEQKEQYRRSLKVLLRVGEERSGWDAVIGLPLELVPQADPFARPATGDLPLQLLSDGRPEEGVKVRAFPVGGHAQDDAVEGRTDAEGKVTLVLPERDQGWVVAAVTMSHEAGREHPWHSVWTSLRIP